MPGHGQRQLFLRADPYPGGIREGGEMLPSWGAQEQKASEPLRGKNQLSLGKRQRREYGEIKPDPVTGDR